LNLKHVLILCEHGLASIRIRYELKQKKTSRMPHALLLEIAYNRVCYMACLFILNT